jgi:hypothetical protein
MNFYILIMIFISSYFFPHERSQTCPTALTYVKYQLEDDQIMIIRYISDDGLFKFYSSDPDENTNLYFREIPCDELSGFSLVLCERTDGEDNGRDYLAFSECGFECSISESHYKKVFWYNEENLIHEGKVLCNE